MTPAQLQKNDVQPNVSVITRDMQADSARASYTGIGFKPRTLILFANVDGADRWNAVVWTWTTGWAAMGMVQTQSTEVWTTGSMELVGSATTWGNRQTCSLVSFDADGFTVDWIKSGAPTAGTARISYLALP